MTGLRAVIFDLDGVIVDSEPNHFEAFNQALAPYGFALDFEYFTCCMVGVSPHESLARLCKDFGLSFDVKSVAESKSRFYEAIAIKNPRPNVLIMDLVHWLKRHFPLALASGAPSKDINVILRTLNLIGIFHTVISGDDVRRGKPDPEILLTAAKKLCLPPESCVVFEDPLPGIEAAHQAGMHAIAVRSEFASGLHFPAVDLVIENVKSLDVGKVGALLLKGKL